MGNGEWACLFPLLVMAVLFFALPGKKRADSSMQRTTQSDNYYGIFGMILGVIIMLLFFMMGR